jgi:hypothetical protein
MDGLLLSFGSNASHELQIVGSAAAGSGNPWGFTEIAPGCSATTSERLLALVQLVFRKVKYLRHLVSTVFDADDGLAFRTALPSKSVGKLENLFQTNVCVAVNQGGVPNVLAL